MSKHIAFLSAAAALLGAAALPGGASAADYYDGGDRPLAYHSQDDVYLDGGRARVEHRQDIRPAEGYRRFPGPVVFDERAPVPRDDRPASVYGEPRWRRPVERFAYGVDRPAGFAPGVEPPFGEGFRPAPFYRPAALPVGPAFGEGYGGPDGGCTVERSRTVTPAGWEKTVTHRTCYRR